MINFASLLFFLCGFILPNEHFPSTSDSPQNADSLSKPPKESIRVFARGEGGYELFRIPAITRASDGTLLLFAEARKRASAGDGGDIDLVLKRSSDNGKTWSAMMILFDEGDQTCGNPVPVVDRQTGTVHLLMMLNNKRVFATQSDDHGQTWKQAREITSDVKPNNWGFFATGPIHGIQIKKGPYKGRMVVPSYADVRTTQGRLQHHSFCIYSDDQGKTWERGNLSPQDDVGECTVVELSDGRLMLNMRSKRPYRSVAFSDDGGSSWYGGRHDTLLIDPLCQASLLDIVCGDGTTLLFANPASQKRQNMTIQISDDDGTTWKNPFQVYDGPSAYSDMVSLGEHGIGLVFESGIKSPHGHIFFRRIHLTTLINE